MPYKIKGKCIYKKDTGKKVGCTKGSVKKYLAALHANASESIDHGLTEEEFQEILRLLNFNTKVTTYSEDGMLMAEFIIIK